MSALPADPRQQEDPLDPGRILRALPDRERETFLAEYRQAVEDARDPAGWPELRRFLRLWSFRTIAVNQPGYYEAWEQASAGTGSGMLTAQADMAQVERMIAHVEAQVEQLPASHRYR
jgi:hypothetical protein